MAPGPQMIHYRCLYPYFSHPPFTHLHCIPGSGWAEYKKSGTVHGIPLPSGLVESQKLPEPLFTPSTKAEQGQHDENISPQRGRSCDKEWIPSDIEAPFVV